MSTPTNLSVESDLDELPCSCCLGSFPPEEVHKLPCWDIYCNDCARELFTTSFQTEGKFPPRCCGQPINLTPQLFSMLGKDIWSVYIAKRTEFKTGRRIYCSNVDCGSFIPDDFKFTGFAVCRDCDSLTCTECRNPCHEGDCSLYDDSAELKELAKKEGWAECYECGRMIEKVEGCDRIECACGMSICYTCKNAIGKCTCEPDHRPLPRGRPLQDLGGFDRQEHQDRAARRQLLKGLGRGESAQSNEEDDEEDDTVPSSPPVLMAPSATTDQPTPPFRRHRQPAHGCNHHSKKVPVNYTKICPRCQHLTSSSIMQCKGCDLLACWKCFKFIRRDQKH
ncbi:uncharacterized protein F4807DRAFT_460320 [Annulohypoxylon truncatum]|uniref:uncharacterized protein n=1 Tax=Annulohypoxylon truncatum TaxID=327061 RepID=UPI0020078CCF|nr:uncharacterized protein F4807DRAFT_460320 [Annulohypoxylon truncatum]KAI1210033.1 hypothetical protein F4807DRAFT_460320 [Annulohypoxylon truncatum]